MFPPTPLLDEAPPLPPAPPWPPALDELEAPGDPPLPPLRQQPDHGKRRVQEKITLDSPLVHQLQRAMLDPLALDVQDQERMPVAGQPGLEILAVAKWIVRKDQPLAAVAQVDFHALLGRNLGQLGGSVDAVGDVEHCEAGGWGLKEEQGKQLPVTRPRRTRRTR